MDDRKKRVLARRKWKVVRLPLCYEGSADASDLAHLSPSERVELVWSLTCDAWAYREDRVPNYTREEMPGRILRASDRTQR